MPNDRCFILVIVGTAYKHINFAESFQVVTLVNLDKIAICGNETPPPQADSDHNTYILLP